MVYRQCIKWKKGLVNTQCEIEVQVSDDNEVYIIKNGIVKRVKSESDIMPYISAISSAFRAIVLSKLDPVLADRLYKLIYKLPPFTEIRKVSERAYSIWSGSYPSFVVFLDLNPDTIRYLPPTRLIEIDSQYYAHIEPLNKSLEKYAEWANNTAYIYGNQMCIALRGCTSFGDEAYSIRSIDQNLNIVKLWLFYIIFGSGILVVNNNVNNLEKFVILRYDKGFEFLESSNDNGKLGIEADNKRISLTLDNEEILSVDYTSSQHIQFSYPLSWKSRYSINDFISSLKMWKGR